MIFRSKKTCVPVIAMMQLGLALAVPQIAHAQVGPTDPGGLLDCSVTEDTVFNLRPNSAPVRGFSPSTWTYKNVTSINGVNYDIKAELVTAVNTSSIALNNGMDKSLNNWRPKTNPYMVIEYTLLYSATGQPATVDRFTFVEGDVDGQFFGGRNDSKMLEVIGFLRDEIASISLNTGNLGTGGRSFLGRNVGSSWLTYRQNSPNNVTNTSHDIAVTYEGKSSFRVLYGMTARNNWVNSTNRNFFFRSLTGSTLADKFTLCPADYSDAPASYGSTVHKFSDSLLIGGVNTIEDAASDGGDTGDEGVTIPELQAGKTATIAVNTTGAGGYLQGWIDFDGSGTFEAGEQIASNLQDNGTGDDFAANDSTITFDVPVPSDAVTTPTFARLRWSTTSGLNAIAAASDGEVEDYAVTISKPVVADLVTVKTLASSNTTPVVGDTVTFEIKVTNNGDDDATNVTLTDKLPAGLTYDSDTPSQGSYDDNTGLWSIGTIENTNNATLQLTGTVDEGEGGKTIENVTTAASTKDQEDLTTDGDDLKESVKVNYTADLSITKTNTPGVNAEADQTDDTVTSGANTTYTVVVTNKGPDSVTGAVVKDTATSGLTCTGIDAVTITGSGVPTGSFTIADLTGSGITLGTLADGQFATITYSCKVN